MNALSHAFKEWAVICQALAEGRQALILRKGGVDENHGHFRVEHTRFWLYPTYVHQQSEGIVHGAADLLERSESRQPPPGTVRLSHFVEVAGVYLVRELASALALSELYLWSDHTVQSRFAYRWPGIYVLTTRVYQASSEHVLEETPEYAGCRSWVELAQPLSIEEAIPILDNVAFDEVIQRVEQILEPSALA